LSVRKILPACAAVLLFASVQARAQYVDPSLPWRTFDTEHFSVHFAEQYRAQARTVAEVAESVYPRVTGWLKWKPESRTHVVVLDSFDISNGYSSPLPFNFIGIILSPPDSGELLQNREWLDLVFTHEFTHTVHMDKASRAPLVMRRIFGRAPPWSLLLFPNTLPNAWSANWVKEGLAVYAETDSSRRWGRLGQSHFEGMMRAEVARGLVPLREIHADGRGFPLNRDYLYGSYFFLFLAERYGAQAIVRYVENYSDNFIPYRMDTNTVPIARKTQDKLWLDYEAWLRARFAANPAQGGEPDEGGRIIARDWTITSPLRTSRGDRWYIRGDGYTRPRLVRQRPGGDAEAVREVVTGTRLAAFSDGEVLLSKPEICDNYNYYYDLYRLSPGGGLERLTRCGRFRFAAPLDDGRIAAIRVVNGEGEVVLLDSRGGFERSLYRAAPGEELSGLAARGDTAAVTSLRDGRWSLVEISGGKASVLVSDAAVKHSPRFGESADEIYFVADYGNVSNVWSWRRGDRRLARWTGARNGILEISAPAGGEMLVTTIEADGGVLRAHGLPASPLEVREAQSAGAPPAAPAPGAAPGAERAYSAWSSLLPRSWYPVAYLDQGALALGVQTFGQDALGLHQYTIAPLWEFTQHTGLGSAAYVYNDRHGLLVNRSMTVKTSDTSNQELTGGVEAYAINETAQWVSLLRRLSLDWRYYGGLGAAFDREIDHDRAAGTSAKAHDERVLGLVAGVDTTRQQFLSEGPSQGQELRLFAETSNHLPGFFSGNFYRGDWRAYLAAGKTVLSLRWNQTYSQPGAEPVQLGGTGASFSETSFALPVLNQREFPLRGYRSGEAVLTGHRSSLVTLEWRIPISDVDRHFMVPPVGTNRVSIAVFTEGGKAWDSAPRQWYRSAGAELLWEVRFGYVFGAQLRMGVAKGFEAPGETQAYLRFGRSF